MYRLGITWIATVAVLAGLSTAGSAGEKGPQPDELFGQLDANGDGKLVSDEISEEQARFFRRLVRIGDKDDNDELTKHEFLQALNRDQEPGRGRFARRVNQRGRGFGPAGGNPEALFDRLDANKDGQLAANEMSDRGKRLVEFALRQAGKQPDESISKDEFVKVLNKRRAESRRFGAGREGAPQGRGFRGPAFFRRLDSDNDGKLSREELAKAVELLDELDENKNGGLEPHELFGFRPDGGRLRVRPGAADEDRLGGGARERSNGKRPAARPEDATPRRNSPEWLQRRFQRLDANSDGKISEDEAPEKLKSRFSKLDKNSDGSIDLKEFDKSRKKRRKRPSPGQSPGKPQQPESDSA